jgi:hypothetical protein
MSASAGEGVGMMLSSFWNHSELVELTSYAQTIDGGKSAQATEKRKAAVRFG